MQDKFAETAFAIQGRRVINLSSYLNEEKARGTGAKEVHRKDLQVLTEKTTSLQGENDSVKLAANEMKHKLAETSAELITMKRTWALEKGLNIVTGKRDEVKTLTANTTRCGISM